MSFAGAVVPVAFLSRMAPSATVAGRRRMRELVPYRDARMKAEKPEASMARMMGKKPIDALVRPGVRL